MCLRFSRLLSDFLLVAGILCCSVSIFSCRDDSDTVEIPMPEGESLSVALTIDFSNETDGYATHTRGADDGQDAAFEAKPNVVSSTRSSGILPTSLYNLEIRQYDQNGKYLNGQSLGNTTIGSKITVPLTVTKANEDCQLLIVARGSSGAVPELKSKTLSEVQKSIIASSSVINSIDPLSDMNTMPYFLYLPHVKVVADATNADKGIIQSSENGTEDVRLRLKRLATRMTLTWTLSENMQKDGYELKEVKLCQVPSTYYLLPEREETSKWGTTYPSTVSEFVDVYRLTGTDLTSANGSKSVWVPANVRGTSSAATAPIHRTKENAPTAASYAEIVVDNTEKQERLYYRAYLGGNAPSDFNLNENMDYNWTLNIKSADYAGDPRIELLDQTPVQSENLVSTANCLMLQPGGNLCFNPYQHTAGTNGWNDYLVNNPGTSPAIKTAIASMKVLWQTKDAGMSGDLVLGYVIDDEHHENLANITKGDDINQARVHVKAPVTNGGNAVIAAYAADGTTVLWSWHIWVTDYAPVPLSGTINASTREGAISTAQTATRGGAVQVYQGISWTDPAGAFYKCVIMDRNLGAIRAGIQNNPLDGVRTFGLLYQGGRKDPFFGTADGTTEEKKTIYDGYGVQTKIERGSLKSLDALVRNPLLYCTDANSYKASGNWNGDKAKTIHDPCPDGWRVPSNGVTPTPNNGVASSVTDNTTKYCMTAGFGSTNTSLVYGVTPPAFNNVMYYNGTSIVAINKTSPVETSTFVGSGFVYYGTNAGPNGDTSIFFPGVSLREHSSGDYRSSVNNNSVFLWSSTPGGISGHMQIYQIQNNLLSSRHYIEWTFGFSVRCVQDNIQPK